MASHICDECHCYFEDFRPWVLKTTPEKTLCPECAPPFELTEREQKIAAWLEAKLWARFERELNDRDYASREPE